MQHSIPDRLSKSENLSGARLFDFFPVRREVGLKCLSRTCRRRSVRSARLVYAGEAIGRKSFLPDGTSAIAFCLTLRFCAAYNQVCNPEISAGDVDQAEIHSADLLFRRRRAAAKGSGRISTEVAAQSAFGGRVSPGRKQRS